MHLRRIKPASQPKKALLPRERLRAIIAERSGERLEHIAILGEAGNWSAGLLDFPGSAERRANVRSAAGELRRDFDLED